MAREKWNWQRDDWGNFTYDTSEIENLEREYLQQSGFSLGVAWHLSREDENDLIVELVRNGTRLDILILGKPLLQRRYSAS